MKKIIIAIDGFAACGKSTLARQLAEKLNYLFLDTGAMYRALTLYLLDNNINWKDEENLKETFKQIKISFKKNTEKKYITYLNEKDVESLIRSPRVSDIVSEVAAISAVRNFLVKQQQEIGKLKGIVMDGRDIGTVVFPNAELKIFVIANMDVRVNRRYEEMLQSGITIAKNEIKRNLEKRDHEETTRKLSPLLMADDAVLLDNSNMNYDEQMSWAYKLAMKLIFA